LATSRLAAVLTVLFAPQSALRPGARGTHNLCCNKDIFPGASIYSADETPLSTLSSMAIRSAAFMMLKRQPERVASALAAVRIAFRFLPEPPFFTAETTGTTQTGDVWARLRL